MSFELLEHLGNKDFLFLMNLGISQRKIPNMNILSLGSKTSQTVFAPAGCMNLHVCEMPRDTTWLSVYSHASGTMRLWLGTTATTSILMPLPFADGFPRLHWMAVQRLTCVCLPTYANIMFWNHIVIITQSIVTDRHRTELQSCLSKSRSSICLELSGCFKTNLPAYNRDPWNKIHLISPLNSTLWLSEERDAITWTTVVLTQLVLISCLKGNAAWSHYEALKHHKRQVVTKNENALFFQEITCDIYFVHVMYIWDPSCLSPTQPLLLQLFTSGPVGGFQTQRVWQSISGRG